MRRILPTLILLTLAAAGEARASDRFAGFYVGAQAGLGISETDLKAPLATKFTMSQRGGFGGGFFGWGTSVSGIYVGVEADFGGSAIRDRGDIVGYRVDRPLSGSIGGRIGYAFTPDTLVFAKVALGMERIEVAGIAAGPARSDWVEGARVGAGVETTISGGLFARLSYDVDFSDRSFPASGIKLNGVTQTGKIGLGYRW